MEVLVVLPCHLGHLVVHDASHSGIRTSEADVEATLNLVRLVIRVGVENGLEGLRWVTLNPLHLVTWQSQPFEVLELTLKTSRCAT